MVDTVKLDQLSNLQDCMSLNADLSDLCIFQVTMHSVPSLKPTMRNPYASTMQDPTAILPL